MKKLLTTVMALALTLSLVACGGDKDKKVKTESASAPVVLKGSADGFAGKIDVEVEKTGDAITKITVAENKETPDIGGKAIEELTKKIVEAGKTDGVQAVSGATVTSDAFLKAVKEAK